MFTSSKFCTDVAMLHACPCHCLLQCQNNNKMKGWISSLLITLSVVGILGLAGAAAPSAGVELVVGLVDIVPAAVPPLTVLSWAQITLQWQSQLHRVGGIQPIHCTGKLWKVNKVVQGSSIQLSFLSPIVEHLIWPLSVPTWFTPPPLEWERRALKTSLNGITWPPAGKGFHRILLLIFLKVCITINQFCIWCVIGLSCSAFTGTGQHQNQLHSLFIQVFYFASPPYFITIKR